MESDFYEGKSSGNGEDECNGYLDKLMAVADVEIEDLRTRDFEWKIRKLNDLRFAKEQFEEKCSANYMQEVRKGLLSQFDFDMLKLICVLKDNPKIIGTGMEELINQASSEEISAVERLESFSELDAYDSDKVREALERKSGQIYEIIKNWYNNQMDEFNKILEATPQSKIRNSIRREILNRYDKRFEVITDGLAKYIKKDSTAAARLFNEYTDIVDGVYELQNKWDEIVASLEYVPINETERKYDTLETREMEKADVIGNLMREIRTDPDTGGVLQKIKESYGELISDHEELRESISKKIDEIATIIDRGEGLIRGMELKSSTEDDPKARAVQLSQREYLASRIEDMRSSLLRLQDYEDHVEAHLVKHRASLDDAADLSRQGGNEGLVTLDQVRIQVVDLLSRLVRKMEEALPLRIQDPLRKGEIRITSKNELRSYLHEENRSSSDGNLSITGSSFRFFKKRILSRPLKLDFSFFYLIHRDRYSTYSVDSRPVSLPEFVDLILYFLDNSASRENATYLALASPTGFDRRIVDYLSGDKRLIARNLTILIVDPESGSIHVNTPSLDPEIKKIVELQIDEEKLYKFHSEIEFYLQAYEDSSLERISKEKKLDLDTLIDTAKKMEKEGELKIEKKMGIHMLKKAN